MKNTFRGFTLIESLVVLFIFAVVCMAFFEMYATGTQLIIESKNRLGATALANQKMEIIRSIAYDSIGTKRWNGDAWVYGIPPGDLLEDEDIAVNTRTYHVHTFVQYVDHPFDGTAGGSPNDAIPTDSKRVRLTVTWGEGTPKQTVALVSSISPDGVETSSGGGVLSINVLDASGAGVAGAGVHIQNTSAGVDVTTQTDSTGNILLPGAPAGSQNYELTVSKSGYYGAVTYPAFPTTAYSPVDVHASVVADTLNQKTVVMDQQSDISFTAEDPFGEALSDISYELVGGRVLGTDPGTGAAVYSLNESGATDASGEADFPDESYGQYTLVFSDARYEFYKFDPEPLLSDVLDIPPGVTADIKAILLDTELGSLKVTVTSEIDGSPVAGATVSLQNTLLGYTAEATTDQYGLAYFPTALPELVDGSYDLEVSASGFQSKNETATISGSLVEMDVLMTAQ